MSRAVLLKGLEEEQFIFYTNYKSRKARHLEQNPHATMHFPWFSIERQVIVAGRVTKLTTDQSEEYFNSRPSMSKLGAWASQQSEPLASREALEESFLKAREKWGENPPKPPHWGGFALEPESIEFWQGGGTPLRKADMNSCPFSQFSAWLLDAQNEKIPDPNACSLCTVDQDSKPMSRAVLLKGLEEEQFIFYTNYKSRKARHLEQNPHATMHFPWFSIERQVIVAGRVTKLTTDQSEEYFNSRPSMSKLGAWASQQSEPLASREALEIPNR